MKVFVKDLTEMQREIFDEYIKNPRPGLGIKTVVLDGAEPYVIFE
jgi:hypothetical protein